MGAQLFAIGFDPSETGTWSFRIEIAGKQLSDNNPSDTVITRKVVLYTNWKNAVATSGRAEYSQDSNQSDFVLELRALIGNLASPVQDQIYFDKFTVTPYGYEFSYVNWELVNSI